MCVHSGQRRGCALARESGTGDDSVILTPTRAEISEPPKVESVIPISNAQSSRSRPPPSSYPSPSSLPSRRARNHAQEVWARQRTGTHTKPALNGRTRDNANADDADSSTDWGVPRRRGGGDERARGPRGRRPARPLDPTTCAEGRTFPQISTTNENPAPSESPPAVNPHASFDFALSASASMRCAARPRRRNHSFVPAMRLR